MKTKKKLIFSLILALALCVGVIFAATLSMSAEDATVTASGTCGAYGDNLTWTLTSDGTLTISGEGRMNEYFPGDTPWYDSASVITSVVVEDGVATIGSNAFYDCTSLTSVTIPDSVTTIGGGVFVTTAYYNDENNWEDGVLYVDNWLIAADKDAVTGDYTIKSDTVGIAKSAFSNCTNLTGITIPGSVMSISESAFFGCSNLTSATIGNGVTEILREAFESCTSLAYVTIPDSVTFISVWSFAGCKSLYRISIPASVTEISWEVFLDCTGLTEIIFEG
ncbi:MAG: leucine-rich repeat domain-containing protein, partial [Firmicutes bacterium]|nr:leucine-rich repeat domain-containing protein [Bacillota bacterium]